SSTFSSPPAASTSARKAGLSSALPPLSVAPARYATHRPSSEGDGDAAPGPPVVGAAWVTGGGSAGGADPRPEIGLGIVPVAASAAPPTAVTAAAATAALMVSSFATASLSMECLLAAGEPAG